MSHGHLRVVGGSLAIAVALAITATSPADAAGHCNDTVITQKNTGQSLVIRQCDRVTIRLQQASDAGYYWKLAHRPDKSILNLLENKTVRPKSEQGRVGGHTVRLVIYRAVGTGSTGLKLVESRSFQPHSQIAKFKLLVKVK